MGLNLALLASDGVGPAVTTQSLNVLEAVGEGSGHSFNFNEGLVGGVAMDTAGRALSYETCALSDMPRLDWIGE
jgi:3-isopropylmalate dehydrogenase